MFRPSGEPHGHAQGHPRGPRPHHALPELPGGVRQRAPGGSSSVSGRRATSSRLSSASSPKQVGIRSGGRRGCRRWGRREGGAEQAFEPRTRASEGAAGAGRPSWGVAAPPHRVPRVKRRAASDFQVGCRVKVFCRRRRRQPHRGAGELGGCRGSRVPRGDRRPQQGGVRRRRRRGARPGRGRRESRPADVRRRFRNLRRRARARLRARRRLRRRRLRRRSTGRRREEDAGRLATLGISVSRRTLAKEENATDESAGGGPGARELRRRNPRAPPPAQVVTRTKTASPTTRGSGQCWSG